MATSAWWYFCGGIDILDGLTTAFVDWFSGLVCSLFL
jgi:hypothetical protein